MNHLSKVPGNRIRAANDGTVRESGRYVLYWMTSNRRLEWNFALQRAADWAAEMNRPLVILEALRADYSWASDRFHRFVMDGMAEKQRRLTASTVSYVPYVEPAAGAGSGLVPTLAKHAAVVVSDDSPMFFLPAMLSAASARSETLFEAVDAAGLLPLSAVARDYASAYSFRRFLQKELPQHLDSFPDPEPLEGFDSPALDAPLLDELLVEYQTASLDDLENPATLAALPVDHSVTTLSVTGGSAAARHLLSHFVTHLLPRYGEERNQPDSEHGSRLSAYLHFGHISAHQVFATIAAEEMWAPVNLATSANGSRQGWWGMSANSEAFLDQLVTWRELGMNMSHHRSDYRDYSSLPEWALATLEAHRNDERPHVYGIAELENSATHDDLWNAAQSQLVVDGRIHNYLRMLWGKKVLEWSASPEQALQTMIELNNKYALDGRDPNSYSGIFWVLGRYDRPWGPERPIFGKVRYMSSTNAARKLRLTEYLRTHAPQRGQEVAVS